MNNNMLQQRGRLHLGDEGVLVRLRLQEGDVCHERDEDAIHLARVVRDERVVELAVRQQHQLKARTRRRSFCGGRCLCARRRTRGCRELHLRRNRIAALAAAYIRHGGAIGGTLFTANRALFLCILSKVLRSRKSLKTIY